LEKIHPIGGVWSLLTGSARMTKLDIVRVKSTRYDALSSGLIGTQARHDGVHMCGLRRLTQDRGIMQNDAGSTTGVFVHPGGLCESTRVGAGTRIWAFAHVLSGAVIGSDCNICDGAYVESGAVVGDRVTVKNKVLIFEGVTIEDDVFLGPGVVFTNDLRPRAHIKRSGDALSRTTVQRGATLGAGVVVVCGTVIGANAFVGAGAVVTRDVPAHAFMVGNPARQIGWACTCGDRLDDDLTCPSCGRTFAIDSHDGTAAPSLSKADRVDDPDYPTGQVG
jgi:UDP-2-acetamido-3-amino-2,3-dideoxy-glucuronate N-acetyltransferase